MLLWFVVAKLKVEYMGGLEPPKIVDTLCKIMIIIRIRIRSSTEIRFGL